MKQTGFFKLVGLSKPAGATLELLNSPGESFKATVDMPQDRFNALFDYIKGDWATTRHATCEYDYLTDDGTPANCIVKIISER